MSGEIIFALERPNWNARFPPACMLRSSQIQTAISRIQGSMLARIVHHPWSSTSASMTTPFSSSSVRRDSVISPGSVVSKRAMSCPFRFTGERSSPLTLRPSITVTSWTLPWSS